MSRWVVLAAVAGVLVGGGGALAVDDGSEPEPSSGVVAATVSPSMGAEACRTPLAVAANLNPERGSQWKVEVVAAPGDERFSGLVEPAHEADAPAIFSVGIPATYASGAVVEGRHDVLVYDPNGELRARGTARIIPERTMEPSQCRSGAG